MGLLVTVCKRGGLLCSTKNIFRTEADIFQQAIERANEFHDHSATDLLGVKHVTGRSQLSCQTAPTRNAKKTASDGLHRIWYRWHMAVLKRSQVPGLKKLNPGFRMLHLFCWTVAIVQLMCTEGGVKATLTKS